VGIYKYSIKVKDGERNFISTC